jgi:hypothetical protein
MNIYTHHTQLKISNTVTNLLAATWTVIAIICMFVSSLFILAIFQGIDDQMELGALVIYAFVLLVVGVASLMQIPTYWKKRRAHAQNVFSARWREQQEEDGHYETLHGGVSA